MQQKKNKKKVMLGQTLEKIIFKSHTAKGFNEVLAKLHIRHCNDSAVAIKGPLGNFLPIERIEKVNKILSKINLMI